MIWRELQLERAPGVTAGLALTDCGPGLNVVFGPNGIGKSTLSRAARAALWRSESFEHSHLRGRVVSRGDEWTIEREGSMPARWSGPTQHEPRVPDQRFRDCFHLGLEDLLRQGGTEQAIARELRLEMSGRYDLDAVAALERKRTANSHPVRAARKTLIEARKNVDLLEQTARELLHREKSLAPLKAEMHKLVATTADRIALEDLLRVAETRAELQSLRESIAADDPLLAHFEARDDFKRLAELEQERTASRALIGRLRGEFDSASHQLLALALPSDGIDAALLREGAARARRIQTIHDELLPKLRSELTALDGELAGVRGPDVSWIRDDIDAAQELLDRHRLLKAELVAIERGLERAEAGPTQDGRDPQRSILLLLEWLSAGAQHATSSTRLFGTSVLAAVLLLVLIAVDLSGVFVPAWLYLGPLAFAIAVAVQARGGKSNEPTDRERARRRFLESGAEPPASWDAAGVGRLLEDLIDARVDREFDGSLRTWSESLNQQRKDREREAAELASRELELRERLGAQDTGELDLRFLLRGLERDARRRGLRAQVADLDRELDDELRKLQALLESAGVGRADDLRAAVARWEDFAVRAAQEPERRLARDNVAGRLRDAQAQAARQSEQRNAFLEARRIEDSDIERALGLASSFPDHRERRQRLQELERNVAKTRKRWADREDLLNLDAAELSARLIAGAAADERKTVLQAEIAAIDADVRHQREDTRLVQREVELRNALDGMEEVRDSVLEGIAMDALLNEVQDRHRQEGRPKVLARAEQHFADYTRHRYELEQREGDELGVIETSTRRRLSPDQLSSGTRTQLLIALRLAYAESIEGDDMLPIFLDEALLTSDPERFQEVARSLGRMVEEGRQVFYLTAEPREEVEWRNALGAAGGDVKVHDLGGQLAALRRVAGSSLELAALPPVPAPVGDDSASYAAALGGLPAVDGFQSADALHLLHIYWDLPQVAHRVIREHRSQVGAARAFLAASVDSPWNAAERAGFAARVELAERVLGLWRIGRAPRLDAELLRGTSLAKSKKLEEVVELAGQLGWDGSALLAALEDKRVKGLHGSSIAALREDLEAGERLATGVPLDFDDLLARALNDAESLIARGALTREQARQLTHRLYRRLTPAGVDSGDSSES